MDLIVWRHAQAQLHPDPVSGAPGDAADLARRLTAHGKDQAQKMAAWLDHRLPGDAVVWCSPAVRAEQTAAALKRRSKLQPALAPDGDPLALLALAQWPRGQGTVVMVGHQPNLGRVVAHLLKLADGECAIKKGAVWWLRHRERDGMAQTVLVTVQTPELM